MTIAIEEHGDAGLRNLSNVSSASGIDKLWVVYQFDSVFGFGPGFAGGGAFASIRPTIHSSV